MKNRKFRMKNEGINLFYDGRPDAHFDPHSVFQLFDLLNTFCSSLLNACTLSAPTGIKYAAHGSYVLDMRLE